MQALKVGSEPFGQGIWSSVTDSDLAEGSTWALNKLEASLLEGTSGGPGQDTGLSSLPLLFNGLEAYLVQQSKKNKVLSIKIEQEGENCQFQMIRLYV